MIFKTLHVVCDQDGCTRFSEGERGVSQALPLIRQIRALGWVASDGRQYCPEHIDMADGSRPCCHATGPNHHPACTTNRTEQQ